MDILKKALASIAIILIIQPSTTILAQKAEPTGCWGRCLGCLKKTAAGAEAVGKAVEPILILAGTAVTIALPEAAPIFAAIQYCFAASQPALSALLKVCNDTTVTTPTTFLRSLSDNGVADATINALVTQLEAAGINLSAGNEATILKVKKIVSLALVASQATAAELTRGAPELGTPAIRMLTQANFERRFTAEFELQESLK